VAQVPPSATEVARYSGLHAAAHKGDLPQIKKLLASGADLNARDPFGRTALHIASFARQREVIRLLGQAGADLHLLENDRYDAVTIAAVADDEATLRVLLALGASARLTTSRYDGTALIAAAHLGHDGVVKQLIAAKAPLDHVNNLHWTAMIEAVVLGDGGLRVAGFVGSRCQHPVGRPRRQHTAGPGSHQKLRRPGAHAGTGWRQVDQQCGTSAVRDVSSDPARLYGSSLAWVGGRQRHSGLSAQKIGNS
jgi:hypothetical protein